MRAKVSGHVKAFGTVKERQRIKQDRLLCIMGSDGGDVDDLRTTLGELTMLRYAVDELAEIVPRGKTAGGGDAARQVVGRRRVRTVWTGHGAVRAPCPLVRVYANAAA